MKTSKKQKNISQEILSSFHLDEEKVSFRLRNNKRIKKSRLIVSPEEGLVIETPKEPSLNHAYRIINKRQDWIKEALKSIRKKQLKAFDIKKSINTTLIFGKEKSVYIRTNQNRNYVLETKNNIFLGFEKQRVPHLEKEMRLEYWLREKAQQYFPIRARQINKSRFQYEKIIVKDLKTLWGSCSETGNISINWKLIMAPKKISDYIIYHELAHTKHMNHSKKFWNEVGKVCPKYDDHEKWISKYGFVLNIKNISFL